MKVPRLLPPESGNARQSMVQGGTSHVPSNVNVTGCRTVGFVVETRNAAVGAAEATPTVERTITNGSSRARDRAPSALTGLPRDVMWRLSVSARARWTSRLRMRVGRGAVIPPIGDAF